MGYLGIILGGILWVPVLLIAGIGGLFCLLLFFIVGCFVPPIPPNSVSHDA